MTQQHKFKSKKKKDIKKIFFRTTSDHSSKRDDLKPNYYYQSRSSICTIFSHLCSSEMIELFKTVIGVPKLAEWAEQHLVTVFKDVDPQKVTINYEKSLGKGSSAVVYQGKFEGTDVAIKKTYVGYEDEFFSEAVYMSLVNHPNVVRCLGMSTGSLITIMEYCSRGSLFNLLREMEDISVELMIRLALSAARGVSELHRLQIIHRDVKSPNILVSQDFECKVTDFGTVRIVDPSKTMTGNMGSCLWMAPEILQNMRYTEKADVYSFAIVLWELVEKDLPWKDVKSWHIEKTVAVKKMRPPFTKECPLSYQKLVKNCWAANPRKRPSFPEIVSTLENISREYCHYDDTSESSGSHSEHLSNGQLSPKYTRTPTSIVFRQLSSDDQQQTNSVEKKDSRQVLNLFGSLRKPKRTKDTRLGVLFESHPQSLSPTPRSSAFQEAKSESLLHKSTPHLNLLIPTSSLDSPPKVSPKVSPLNLNQTGAHPINSNKPELQNSKTLLSGLISPRRSRSKTEI